MRASTGTSYTAAANASAHDRSSSLGARHHLRGYDKLLISASMLFIRLVPCLETKAVLVGFRRTSRARSLR